MGSLGTRRSFRPTAERRRARKADRLESCSARGSSPHRSAMAPGHDHMTINPVVAAVGGRLGSPAREVLKAEIARRRQAYKHLVDKLTERLGGCGASYVPSAIASCPCRGAGTWRTALAALGAPPSAPPVLEHPRGCMRWLPVEPRRPTWISTRRPWQPSRQPCRDRRGASRPLGGFAIAAGPNSSDRIFRYSHFAAPRTAKLRYTVTWVGFMPEAVDEHPTVGDLGFPATPGFALAALPMALHRHARQTVQPSRSSYRSKSGPIPR